MTKTYEHAINICIKRYRKLIKTTSLYKDHNKFWNSVYYELNELYKYINDNNITYSDKDELNYLKVRYLIEKFGYYYCKDRSYINRWRLVFIYVHIMTLVSRQSKRQNKEENN